MVIPLRRRLTGRGQGRLIDFADLSPESKDGGSPLAMDASGNIKLLSVLEMPQPVAELFRKHTELVVGTLDEAHRLKPDALLCSIGPASPDTAAIAPLPHPIRPPPTHSVGFAQHQQQA